MSYTHLNTTIAYVVKVITLAASLVLAVVAGFSAFWTGIFANITDLAFESNAGELLIGAALFMVVAGVAYAVQWVTEQSWDIDLSEVEVPEARFAFNEAVAA